MSSRRALQAAALFGMVLGAILGLPVLFVFADACGGEFGLWESGPAGTWLRNQLVQLFEGLFGSVTNLYLLIGVGPSAAPYCADVTLIILFVAAIIILSGDLRAHAKMSAARIRKVFLE